MCKIKFITPAVFILAAFLALNTTVLPEAQKKDQIPDILAVATFGKNVMLSDLGGEIGTWELDPEDDDQRIAVSFDKETGAGKSGYLFRVEYDLNSKKPAANGFWIQLGGLDASLFDHFEFLVKGEPTVGHTTVFKVEFKKAQLDDEGHEETVKGSYIVKGVTGVWQKVSIPLNVMNGIPAWNALREFVVTFEKKRADRLKGTLYFDDFKFVRTGNPGPSVRDVVRHRKKKTDYAIASREFASFLISRLKGFPAGIYSGKKFSADDKAMLREVASDTWKYFDNLVDREFSLPIDNISFSSGGILTNQTRIGDYTNITNVGLYLMCVIAAYDFKFLTAGEAAKRLKATLDSVERLEKYKGFPYNYYDITIFQRTSNFISFVDSGWLAAGLIVARNAFPEEVGSQCSKLLDGMDFSFFYDPVEGSMYHGYYTNIDYYSEYHYGVLYSETRAASYIAIGKGDVPKEHWFNLARTFSADWLWQTQAPKGRRLKKYLKFTTEGGYYLYDNIKFVPSWGGSMFEALMPPIIIDEKRLAPKGLGINDARHAYIQIKHALGKLAYPVFGMSPSCTPAGPYKEYGVRSLGMKGYREGVVTPHATFLALEFAPKECIANIRKMLDTYKAYGEYGFYDAIDMNTGGVALTYLCLDQAMTFLALDNYLNDGAVRKRFSADPINKAAEELLRVEDFFE